MAPGGVDSFILNHGWLLLHFGCSDITWQGAMCLSEVESTSQFLPQIIEAFQAPLRELLCVPGVVDVVRHAKWLLIVPSTIADYQRRQLRSNAPTFFPMM